MLALDTTGKNCAVALRRDGRDDLVDCEPIGRGHAERLAPMVETILATGGLVPGDLDRIGVTIGPGSFAGTRVGVAFARGLALATGATAYGVSNLAVWAAMQPQRWPVNAVHDAKRGEVIVQTWSQSGAGEAGRLELEDARAQLDGLNLCGPGAGLIDPDQAETRELDLAVLLNLTAAAEPLQSPPAPFYARPPDAKLPGGIDP